MSFDAIENVTNDDAYIDNMDAVATTDGFRFETPSFDPRDDVYSPDDPEERDSADDVDVRRLFSQPSVDKLRWHYTETPFAGTVVDKPVLDAFKHGFEVTNEPTGAIETWLTETYVPLQKTARRKARRDGVSFIYFHLRDASGDVSESPQNVQAVTNHEVLTLDDMTPSMTEGQVAEYVDYDEKQLYVTHEGIVVVNDITSPDNEEFVGIIYEHVNAQNGRSEGETFIHGDRLQPFVNNSTADGPLEKVTFGSIQGESILTPINHELDAMAKATWSLGQTLYRYAGPLHVVTIDEEAARGSIDDVEEHVEGLNENLDDLTTASEVTLPPGHDMKVPNTGDTLDPEPYIEGIISQICAGVEMTESVLMGTQAGTVSGGETDIKNYYNQVERYRSTTAVEKQREAARMMSGWSGTDIHNFHLGFKIDWNALFKLDKLDAMEAISRLVQSGSTAINSYVLKPNEVRSIFEEEWAELGVDVDLDELTEEDFDDLDRVNVSRNEQTMGSEEAEIEGNPRVGQHGGGREPEQTTDPSDPT